MARLFLQLLREVREKEEVVLYGHLLTVPEEELRDALAFLKDEYWRESVDYPYEPPGFHAEAASWGARTLYIAAQLLLYRESKPTELEALLPAYAGEPDAAAHLSADLSLRFLPMLIRHFRLIDADDPLLPLLEARLRPWIYSMIPELTQVHEEQLLPVLAHECLTRLFTDRVIACKNVSIARHPLLETHIKGSLGLHASVFWNEFQNLDEIPS